jgi:hypothetical protein
MDKMIFFVIVLISNLVWLQNRRGTDSASSSEASPNAVLQDTSLSPRLLREHQLFSSLEIFWRNF